jgi:septal ring factor EnvC (AmiA/AmiB activator)
MATDKNGFILYSDIIHTLEKLTDEKAGMLFKHILRYVNDLNPISNDILIDIAFEPIKQQLKRDLDKWQGIREKRSAAGKQSAQQKQQMLTSVESDKQTSTDSTDNVNVNVKDIYRSFAHLSISEDEVKKLLEKNTILQIDNILNDIENYKGNTKYKSLYLTAVKWLQKNEPTSEGISPEEIKARKYGYIN